MNFEESDNVQRATLLNLVDKFFVPSSSGIEIKHGATIKTSIKH